MVFKGDSGVMKALHLLVLFALAVSFATAASAAVIDIDDGDEEIWVQSDDSTLDDEVECSNAEPESVSVFDPAGNEIVTDGTPESFSVGFDTGSDFGEYTVEGSCSDGTTAEDNFSVKMLEADLIEPEPNQKVPVYRTEEFEFSLGVKVKGASSKPDYKKLGFESKFFGSDSKETRTATLSGGTSSPYDLEVEVPEELSTGEAAFIPQVSYKEGYSVSGLEDDEFLTLQIQKPWKFKVTNRTPEDNRINYQELGSLSMNVQVLNRGNPERGLISDDFYINVKDWNGNTVKNFEEKKWVDSEVLSQQNGKYRLELSQRPDLDIGRYRLEFGLDKDGGRRIASLPVYNYLLLQGRIKDAQGKLIDADIEAKKDGVVKSFRVNKGEYSGQLLPGDYNFTVTLPKVSAMIQGVKLQPGVQGAIRYDDVPSEDLNTGFEGIDVVNAIGLTFGYPFESASLEMNYDPSRVGFSNVKVLECKGWNLDRRNCRGEWNTLNSSEIRVYPTVGRAVFPASPVNISDGRRKMLNAYMVVRNTKLQEDYFDVSETRVPVGSSVPIEGKITRPDGSPVEGVKVNLSLMRSGKEVRRAQLQTDSSGIYGTNLRMPDKKGIYDIKYTAAKKPYIGLKKDVDKRVETFIEKGIGVSVPDQVSFTPGERVETEFTVVNTGQSELKNVKLYIRDLNNDWYSFQQNSWDSLGPGASRTAVMITELPEDYCEGECREYPTFQVEATAVSGDNPDINAIESVRAEVTKEANATSTSTSDNEEGGMNLGNPAKITGDFIEQRSSLNIAIGLITVFMLVLAAAVKKKNEGSGRGSVRSSVSTGGGRSSGRTTVEKPKVSSERNSEEGTDNSGDDRKEESSEEASAEEDESDTGTEGNVCPECGEEFDTESALELHKDINEVE